LSTERETYRDELADCLRRAMAGLSEEEARLFLEESTLTLDDMILATEAALPETKLADYPHKFGIIGQSPKMQEVYDLIAKMAPSDYPVLITGQSGTGKELAARAIHDQSKRKRRTYLAENCAAIPETLLESILFGHKRGSFTGAVHDNPGHFVAANKGTLFLDELGDMPLVMQGKLLRVLQDGEVRAVGGDKIQKVDVRLVAATNKNLEVQVREKAFREDLYYRLNVLQIHLPPLNERGEDIQLLADFFLAKAAGEARRELRFSNTARTYMAEHAWPGNVRQLENAVRRAAALANGDEIQTSDLST
jgi:transcriptional regulator with GAF, ATPase, and Fis domain